jgi:hypothetical protein
MLLTSVLAGPLVVPLACRAAGAPVGALVRDGLVPAILSSALPLAAMALVWVVLPESPGRLAAGLGVGAAVAGAIAVAQVGTARLRAVAAELRLRREPSPDLA